MTRSTLKEYTKLFLSRIWLPLIIIAAAVGLDQLTKHLATVHLKSIPTLPLWEGVFHLTYATNTGGAWSILSSPEQRWILLTVSTLGIIGMLVCIGFWRGLSRLSCIGLAMMVGGGVGNMIDRLVNGFVVDMLDFCLINYPIFNVADCFICIGAGVLILAFILEWIAEEKAKKAKKSETVEEE